MKGTYVLKGCGGHARSVADAILADNPDAEILFVDDNAKPGEMIIGFSAVTEMPPGDYPVILASGDNQRRKDESANHNIRSYISQTAHIGKDSSVQEGCFIGCGAHVGPDTIIGKGSIVNTNAVVEHNVVVGKFCHIAPNATICGGCKLGDMVLIGAGAVVKPYTTIASGVIVGSGAVVTKNLQVPGKYIGSPARRLS